MWKPLSLAVLILLSAATSGRAQVLVLEPGSTPEGDYLRGLGFAELARGLGAKSSAQAESIHLNTWIRFNEYVAASLAMQNYLNAIHRHQLQMQRLENYRKIHDRILNSPEARDVDTGDALNEILEKMNSGVNSESVHSTPAIGLTVDEVRRLPFKVAGLGAQSFSMRRLVLRQRGKWPLAFQDPRFDGVRKDYEDALANVLEQEVEGATSIAAIDRLSAAVKNMGTDLERAFRDRPNDRRNIEGAQRIRELESTVEMLKTHRLQLALHDLDHYSGTTVNDLRQYMRNHNLQFGAAVTPEEKAIFPEIYSRLRTHYEMVKNPEAEGQPAPVHP
ncbi:hypothetical protein [Paludisphaera rhizosphaerae]|uniref:hypothetical protein n=1 Tax=Paludisphaera rhizosphaerae TaxID=2711216 RepID=UPI0013E9B704|nr:hypothetical protein [Paludisphaera rhizosphaerae]